MTDMLDAPESDADANRRRRAIWGLTVLAFVAIIFVSLLILFGGGSGPSDHPTANAVPTGPAVTYTSRAPASTSASSAATSRTSTSTAPTTSLPARPARAGNPCDGQSSCLVAGDGGALAALNAFRAQHGLPPVAGGVSANAQTCALNQGSGSTCVPHYAWTGVPTQDGAKAIEKISQFGSSWMLDTGIQRIDIGWAYVGGQYQCVLLKSP
jgi:hypothetical protein